MSTTIFMSSFNESTVEDAALEWFGDLGYEVAHGPRIAPGEPEAERDSFGEAVLTGRLREAIRRLNPRISDEAREEAWRKARRPRGAGNGEHIGWNY
jgi:type I restriction enzyme R subunit